jgi:uncharacterized protein (TIGR02145 family)
MKQLFLSIAIALFSTVAFSQVGIGTTNPDASSLLDVESTTKGFLPPRLTSVQRNAIASPAEGLTIYNTENKCLETFIGLGWINLCDGSALNVTNACDPTSPTVVVDVVAAGETWMDRNLGASQAATGSTDFLAYGNLYQWGRGSDGHECINWTSPTGSDGDEQTNESIGASSSTSPGSTFITGSNNWYSGSESDNLWQGANGINNPCPSGYRLPIGTELQALDDSFAPNNAGGAATSPVKMPVAGGRSSSGGALDGVGSDGYYWSSTVSGDYARFLFFNSSRSLVSTNFRANGLSVRCLKD